MAVTDLPDPDSPTTEKTWPRLDVERHAVDGLDHAVVGVEHGAQVAHREEQLTIFGGSGGAGHHSELRVEGVAQTVADRGRRRARSSVIAMPGKKTR